MGSPAKLLVLATSFPTSRQLGLLDFIFENANYFSKSKVLSVLGTQERMHQPAHFPLNTHDRDPEGKGSWKRSQGLGLEPEGREHRERLS